MCRGERRDDVVWHDTSRCLRPRELARALPTAAKRSHAPSWAPRARRRGFDLSAGADAACRGHLSGWRLNRAGYVLCPRRNRARQGAARLHGRGRTRSAETQGRGPAEPGLRPFSLPCDAGGGRAAPWRSQVTRNAVSQECPLHSAHVPAAHRELDDSSCHGTDGGLCHSGLSFTRHPVGHRVASLVPSVDPAALLLSSIPSCSCPL